MGSTYKILVTGPFSAGKTEFIRAISDIPIVTTERPISDEFKAVKDETTVAMDYGQVKLGEDMLHLYGTPGQPRFDFMWDILSQEMHGFVLLVDSCDRGTFGDARKLVRFFRRRAGVPYVVAANKQDGEKPLSVEEVRKALHVNEDVPVVPCVAVDKDKVRAVLGALQALLNA